MDFWPRLGLPWGIAGASLPGQRSTDQADQEASPGIVVDFKAQGERGEHMFIKTSIRNDHISL